MFQALFSLRSSSRNSSSDSECTTLADVPSGGKAEIIGFSAGFPPDRRAYLQAYGLVENYSVQVVQHSPVIIVKIDHIELALESDLARGILVQSSVTDQEDRLPNPPRR
jgi:Fe2+ transport system protein FeoA